MILMQIAFQRTNLAVPGQDVLTANPVAIAGLIASPLRTLAQNIVIPSVLVLGTMIFACMTMEVPSAFLPEKIVMDDETQVLVDTIWSDLGISLTSRRE